MSVAIIPKSTMSAPCSRAPSMKAADRLGEDTRMSRPTPIRPALRKATNARPICLKACSSSSAGSTPRTSYALKISVFMGGRSRSQPAVFGDFRLVTDDPALDAGVAADAAAAADDHVAHVGFFRNMRVRPDHSTRHRGALIHSAVFAEHRVWPDPR